MKLAPDVLMIRVEGTAHENGPEAKGGLVTVHALWWVLLAASFFLASAWQPLARASRVWRTKVMFDGESGLGGDGWWGQDGHRRAYLHTAGDASAENHEGTRQRHEADFVGQERGYN